MNANIDGCFITTLNTFNVMIKFHWEVTTSLITVWIELSMHCIHTSIDGFMWIFLNVTF